MQPARIDRDARIASRRESVVVCISVETPSPLEDCLKRVLTHTSGEVPIVLLAGANQSEALEAIASFDFPEGHELYYLEREGEVRLLELVAAISDPADVVLMPSSCLVAGGWLEGLAAAAYSDSRIATATALGGRDTEASGIEDAAAAIRASSLRLRPQVAEPGRCALIRRSAIELMAPPAMDWSRGFAEACVRTGLSHVLADEVFVRDARADGSSPQADDGVASASLQRSLSRVRRALRGTSVVIDARILSKPTTGVQVHVLELIGALARTGKLRLTAVVPHQLSDATADELASFSSVSLVGLEEASGGTLEKADIVHRPYQLSDPGDIGFLASLGDRLIVTQHDLIGYENPSYFTSAAAWQGYRELTRAALATADHVVFCSRYALHRAVGEELLEPSRASVIANGTDQRRRQRDRPASRPALTAALAPDAEILLCLGNDYSHKNRLFALRILEHLHTDHGWPGYLVLAGPTVASGSTKPDELQWLASHAAIAPFVVDVGAVSEAEKTWLLGRAALVLYPSVYEGFGLIPFEAADHDVPCMWAAVSSLAEVLPEQAATILPWNARASATRALELLRSERARKDNVEAIRAAGKAFTWDATAAQLIELYENTCDTQPTPASRLARRGLLATSLSEDAMRLVGPGGALPPEVERPLLAVATHPGLADRVFGALKLGYRISYNLRRLRSSGPAARGNGHRRR